MDVELISASAGSGKTTRLTEVVLQAIRTGQARPGALLCTTFTRQAAAQLQSRLRTRLVADGHHASAEELAGARIGTVNAVCGSLSVEFALELGLSPELRVLDEHAESDLLKVAIGESVSSSDLEALASLRSRMPDFDWQQAVAQLVPLARQNLIASEDLRAQAAHSAHGLLRLLPDPPVDEEAQVTGPLRGALQTFLVAARAEGPPSEKGLRLALEFAEDCWLRLCRGEHLPWADWAKLSELGTTQRSLQLAEPVRRAAAAHERHPLLRTDLAEAIRWVHELAARTLEAYARHKRERGVLDFGDQELFAFQLLGRPELRERLAQGLDLVVVDEFQDTSPLQLSIFLRLASLARRSVWVGDQKQSIYGFRGADPSLMDSVLAAFGGARPLEVLPFSYRSRPGLVEATSRLFARAFPAQGIPPERVVLRPRRFDPPQPMGETPRVWIEDWTLPAKNLRQELELLAAGVQELLADATVRVQDVSGAHRRPGPADVAVLCHSNQGCLRVAEALLGLGIRAVVPRARLLDTHEGRAALAGLRLWVDPKDALACAELARMLVYPEAPQTFLEQALQSPGAAAFDELAPVRRLRQAREEGRSRGPVGVLDAVLDALDLREHCLCWGDCDQRSANLEALRGLAVQFATRPGGAGGVGSAPGLIAHLERVHEAGNDWQGRAEQDAVVVSTWHASKGLEWPVVILHGSSPAPSALGLTVEGADAAIDLQAPLRGRRIRYWPTPYREGSSKTAFHQRLTASAEQAEALRAGQRQGLRLLYVGWTRARDLLVLAGRQGAAAAPYLSALNEEGLALVQSGPEGLLLGGTSVGARVRRPGPGAVGLLAVEPGSTPLASGPRVHPVARLAPSAARGSGWIGRVEAVGERVRLPGRPDLTAVGEVLHGFLGADLPGLDPLSRRAIAEGLLVRWSVREVLTARTVLEVSERWTAWVGRRWPSARWHRELPVVGRMAAGTEVRGTVDLALELEEGWVVVDHKTFPGSRAGVRRRAEAYAGQLGLYAWAISRASGKPVLATYLHLPVSGWVMEVKVDPNGFQSSERSSE
ncbi:MAG: UvrD-helicase domain-containing protein [Myxococcota bacterium]|nr:UvrD-helicase domain-containing protein [Myxococcota bacterium]